jgi:ADP-ribose pyrophosphatase YjhB (NUDIX family)
MTDRGGEKPFLEIVEQLAAIAQNGLTFAKDGYDLERYAQLRTLTAEMMARHSGRPVDEIEDWLSVDRDYATPKIDVRAVIMRNGEVLLVQERADSRWAPPGGWCDIGRSPRETVEREVLEETGLRVTASRLLALYDKRKHDHPFQVPHAYKCYFLCTELDRGSLVGETIETLGAGFFPPDELPPMSLHRATPSQLRRVITLAVSPAAPAEFD